MKVLVIGSGGREHAMVWALRQSPSVDKIFCAPGNPGIAASAECVDIPVTDLERLADFASDHQVDLTLVGPEVPLCAGISDVFKTRGLPVFGPSQAAAELEGSKERAKAFMEKYDLPTAYWEAFSDATSAKSYIIKEFASGKKAVVVKADGLAAGKGVVVAMSPTEATAAIEACFSGVFGEAGARVVVEECLFGLETSVLALTDGKTIVPLASSQDHKRLFDNDEGPNTGGMGTCSPSPGFTPELNAVINETILKPFLEGIQNEGFDYKGIIFIGLMLTDKGPKVLEFNVRFGDPETQVVLARLKSDFAQICKLTAEGRLAEAEIEWSEDCAVCVVMASGGYPENYVKGFPIHGLTEATETGAVVFHAGTAKNAKGEVVNAGGRVLGVTATGKEMRSAIANAYRAVDKISWEGVLFRRDIGQKSFWEC